MTINSIAQEISMPQRVLITAGAGGIGRAMADAFAANGAQVWVADIDKGALETCPAEWGRDALDVADEGAVTDLMRRLAANWGGLDVLKTHHSGGTALRSGGWRHSSDQPYRHSPSRGLREQRTRPMIVRLALATELSMHREPQRVSC
jgi:hypothetical protein